MSYNHSKPTYIKFRGRTVKLVRKDFSTFMKAINLLLFWVKGFMDKYWTTIGDTIYYPTWIKISPLSPSFDRILGHELMHVEQFHKYGVPLMALGYLGPPFFFFTFRWKIEQRPWLYSIQKGAYSPEVAAEILHQAYARPWPKKWMQEWFERHINADLEFDYEIGGFWQ